VDATKDKLIRAAERLMAERGVETVTFAEITKAAGQRNNSAVPYYFGDRLGLVRAVLEKHTVPIAEHRRRLLDDLGARPTLREVVVALVDPIAHEVRHGEGGDDYVRILAHLDSHPDLDPAELGAGATPVTRRLNRMLVTAMPSLPGPVRQLRLDLLVSVLFHGLAAQARTLADPTVGERRKTLFLSNLVDTIEALLTAPVSATTAGALGRSGTRTAARGDRPRGATARRQGISSVVPPSITMTSPV
jgi:AcrR family transcriptional regulator